MYFTFISLDFKSIGGIQTYCKQFIEEFKKYKTLNIKKIELNKKNIFSFKSIYSIYFLLNSKHIFLLHISFMKILFYVFFKKKITIFFYGIDIFKLENRLIKFLLRNNIYVKFVTCSNYSKDFAIKSLKVKKENINVIYPYSDFEKKIFKLNYKNTNNKKIKILSVSRLDGKITDGIWLMINALKNYVNEDIEFNIIGDGNQKSKMEKFVKENNLKYIYFHGYQRQLIKFYEKTDITISISDNAGFGISVLDSMFFGKPSIVSRNSASFEIYNDNNYKFSIKNDHSLDELIILLKNLKQIIQNDNHDYNQYYKKNYSFINYSETIKKYSNELLNDN